MTGKGRPEHNPTDENRTTVINLTIGGATQKQVAEILEINLKTLRKYYREELDLSKLQANGKVIGTAYQMATSGEHPALTIFWLKTQMGWREKDPGTQIPEDKGDLVLVRGDTRKSQQQLEDEKKNGTK